MLNKKVDEANQSIKYLNEKLGVKKKRVKLIEIGNNCVLSKENFVNFFYLLIEGKAE